MSAQLINHSSDLKRLRDEGYDISVSKANYLVLASVPYVNSRKEIKYGTLVSELTLAGDATVRPSTHVVHFAGEFPCNKDGTPLEPLRHGSARETLAPGVVVDHSFSNKPRDGFLDYYEKMTSYANIISGPAQSIDRDVTARPFNPVSTTDEESVFHYLDTATSRAQIANVARKLEGHRVAIVGLGGSGSYILDFLAKTPVGEIHLFDGDDFLQHNAFRSPGAAAIEDLKKRQKKVHYYAAQYSRMHRHVTPHDYHVAAANLPELAAMSFVFLCIDKSEPKVPIVTALEAASVSFIDVGLGIVLESDQLAGQVRLTANTPEKRDHFRARVPQATAADQNEYSTNIQIVELNALSAALAIIRWKKLLHFYRDLDHEHSSSYVIDGNHLQNEDKT